MAVSDPICIVEVEESQRTLLGNALERAGYLTMRCTTGEEAIAHARECCMMLLDLRLPGGGGLDVLRRVKAVAPRLPVVLITAWTDMRDAAAAMREGAMDCLEKPVDPETVMATVEEVLGRRRPAGNDPAPELPPGVVAESAAMRDVFRQAAAAAETDATVLILGESGTGKEVVANFIHARSRRARRTFVAVDCAALPDALIESDLFGHEKGAFTGADRARPGRFMEADGGTLFLDEVGEIPLEIQAAFLRVLETGVFRRVGGDANVRVDVRVIAATNRRLEDAVESGAFRRDLYFRLNVFAITVPPLRERTEDALPIARHFLHSRKKRLSPATERILLGYPWPGNVRELLNALERACIMSRGSLVLPGDLPPHIGTPEKALPQASVLVGDMQAIQRRAILEALEKTGGNKTHAAELLGISRRNLVYKLREYGM